MKRLLLLTIFGTLVYSTNASAIPLPPEDVNNNPLTGLQRMNNSNSQNEEDMVYCSNFGEYDSVPNGKICETSVHGNLTCYKNCCSSSYVICGTGAEGNGAGCTTGGVERFVSCSCKANYRLCENSEGHDENESPCTADGDSKYSTCSCLPSYTEACTGIGEEGSGDFCAVDNEGTTVKKYSSCKCKSSYRTCAQDTGRGEACTADGGNKYLSCQTGGISENCHHISDIFNGRSNTQKMIDGWGDVALAAQAANKFYVGSSNDAYFGAGKWYLPAIGELMDLYGWDWNTAYNMITTGNGQYEGEPDGTGTTLTAVNNALNSLGSTKAAKITFGADRNTTHYFSSSLSSWSRVSANSIQYYSEALGQGEVISKVSTTNGKIRVSTFLENVFTNNATKPQVGNIMYSDLTYGGVNSNKTAVGVVYWVSSDGNSARVINLKDLKFSNASQAEGFNPSTPYTGSIAYYRVVPNNSVGLIDNMLYLNQKISSSYGWKTGVGLLDRIGTCKCNSSWVICPNDDGVGEACSEDGRKKFASCNSTTSQQCSGIGVLHNGYDNTQAIVNQLGNKALAAYATTQFYAPGVSANDSNFGQGKWYLPAIGEAIDMQGMNWDAMISLYTNADGMCNVDLSSNNLDTSNATTIKNSLTAAGGSAVSSLVTSSESNKDHVLKTERYGIQGSYSKTGTSFYVRPTTLLEGAFADETTKPQIGDIMYSDLTYGSEYDNTKTAVGVVYWVSSDGNSARVMALKNLTFTSNNQVGNFNPANPFGNTKPTRWSTVAVDVEAVENIVSEDNTACYFSIHAAERCPYADQQ